MEPLVAALEAGGTKILLASGRTWREVADADASEIPSTTPTETVARIAEWFGARSAPSAVGVASFGPLDLATGTIASTSPKAPWRGLSWVEAISQVLGDVTVVVETDVGAAALAEQRWGAGRERRVVLYVTVGTGIGGGVALDGAILHGLTHPEFGHMVVPRQAGDAYPGVCPIHGDCLEGLASAPALAERWGADPVTLAPEHPAWAMEAAYLADALVNATAVLSPEAVILGGGVMAAPGLLERVRVGLRERLNGYLGVPELTTDLERYVLAPGLGRGAGLVGAFAIARDALRAG